MADQYIVRPALDHEGDDVVPLGLMGLRVGTAYFDEDEWKTLGFKADPGPFVTAEMNLQIIGTPTIMNLPLILIDVTAAALLIESLTAEFDHIGMSARLTAEIDQVRAFARSAGRYDQK